MMLETKLGFQVLDVCPLCGCEPMPLAHGLKTFVSHFDAIIAAQYAYCATCDFSFSTNPFDDDTMAQYYRFNDQLRRDDLTAAEAHHIHEQLDFVQQAVPVEKSARILEIGADFGAFLELAVRRFQAEAYFSEFNIAARERLLLKGFLDLSQQPEDLTFDVIVLRHVFEHVVYPVRYLQALRERLLPHGVVFIEVPDYSCLDLANCDEFQLEHVVSESQNAARP